MRKINITLFVLTILISGCSQEEFLQNKPTSSIGRMFTASFEQNESRTYIEEGNFLCWTKEDQISLFEGCTLNSKYQFEGDTGDRGGTFCKVNSPIDTNYPLNCHYAIYPYNSDIKITENGEISTTLPAVQNYAENSFGLRNNTMIAITENTDDTNLKFKNVGGFLKLYLYGDDVTIKSITLTGNNNEKIAGEVIINPIYNNTPTINMTDDATETITLNCEEGVKINSSEESATEFWLVVPPTMFEVGFTITVIDANNGVFTKYTPNEIAIKRNVIKPMEAIKVEPEYDTLLLPDGDTFNSIVGEYLKNNTSLTKIKFIANSTTTSESSLVTDEDGTIGYIVSNGEWLEIHTSGQEFIANTDCSRMFSGQKEEETPFKRIESIDFSDKFNTSKTEFMAFMFSYCQNLTILDINSFKTSKVVNMYGMFYDCSNLSLLEINNIDTANVYDFCAMFYGCRSLATLDVSNFDTSKAMYVNQMFNNCESLTSLNVCNFDTSNITDMSGWFGNCENLKSLDVSRFNTSNVVYMDGMFSGCQNLESLDVSNFDTSKVERMDLMFCDCRNLTSLNISNFDTSNVINMMWMFLRCNNLTKLDISNFNFSKSPDYSFMFSGIGSNIIDKQILITVSENGYQYLSQADIDCGIGDFKSKFVKSNESDFEIEQDFHIPQGWIFNSYINNILENKSSLKKIKFVANSETTSDLEIYSNKTSSKGYIVTNEEWLEIHTSSPKFVAHEDCCGMFYGMNVNDYSYNSFSQITSISFCDNFDTSNVTNMSSMFSFCSKLEEVNIDVFNTSKVLFMNTMFQACYELNALDTKNFNTCNVTNMEYMFSGCSSLKEIDLQVFLTHNVENMESMFQACSKLESLNLSHFSFIKNPRVNSMFSYVGESSTTKPTVITISENGYTYLTKTTTNCGISSSAKFVKVDGSDW